MRLLLARAFLEARRPRIFVNDQERCPSLLVLNGLFDLRAEASVLPLRTSEATHNEVVQRFRDAFAYNATSRLDFALADVPRRINKIAREAEHEAGECHGLDLIEGELRHMCRGCQVFKPPANQLMLPISPTAQSFRPVSMPFERLLRRSQHRLSIPDSNDLLPHIAPRNLAVRQAMLEDELPFSTIEHQPRIWTAATTPSKPEPPRTEGFRMVGVFEDFAAKGAYHLGDRNHHLEVFDGVVLRDRHVLQAIRAACQSVSAGIRLPDAHPLR